MALFERVRNVMPAEGTATAAGSSMSSVRYRQQSRDAGGVATMLESDEDEDTTDEEETAVEWAVSSKVGVDGEGGADN